MFKKSIILFMLLSFIGNAIIIPNTSKASVIMPEMVMLKGIKVFPDQPLVFDFVIDQGAKTLSEIELQQEITTLAKFFLTTLTIPEKDLWVNLSPYEKDRILSEELSQTLMGERFLEQDNMLKQVASSLTDPTTSLGQKYWEKVYQKANELFGSTEDLPIDGLNKIWIVPGEITVYEKENIAVLGKFHLKVMTEKDYFAMKFQEGNVLTQDVSTDAIQEVLLPVIEKEVNESAFFAPLRQMFSAMILAVWYKELIKNSFLGQVYADQKKIEGVNHYDPLIPEKMFAQYVESFKKGVYHFIHEEIDSKTGEMIPVKYFSGGLDSSQISKSINHQPLLSHTSIDIESLHQAKIVLNPIEGLKGDEEDNINFKNTDFAEVIFSKDPDDFKDILSPFTLGYLKGLYMKHLNRGNQSLKKNIKMFEDFLPSAFLSPEDRRSILALTQAKDIFADPENLRSASEVRLITGLMNAGLGTNLERTSYITAFQRSVIGTKATDLYYPIQINGYTTPGDQELQRENISIAELHLLQILSQKSLYKEQIYQSFVNNESLKSLTDFLDTEYLLDRIDSRSISLKRTYRDVFLETPGIRIAEDMLIQESLPVLNAESEELTNQLLAPGGHGQFAPWMFQMILNQQEIPPEQIRILANGDGVNNMPNPYIIGWVYRNQVPVVMITTTRTGLDLKGGIIGVLKHNESTSIASILELAQAKLAGQEKEFTSVGVTSGEIGGQAFNTNTVILNEGFLRPFFKDLYDIIGEEKFLEVMAPDLILNKKTTTITPDLIVDFFQLEGALGSSLLNLNAYLITTENQKVRDLMRKYNMDRLVHFVNYDTDDRIKGFTPVKYAWDHWLYAYSGCFQLNHATWRIESLLGKHLPAFLSMDKYYTDMTNMHDAFFNTDVFNLNEITIKGSVVLGEAILEGKVIIENRLENVVDLRYYSHRFEQKDRRIYLKDVHVTIHEDDSLSITPLSDFSQKMNNIDTVGGIDFEYILPNIVIEKNSHQAMTVHFSNQDIVNFKNGHFDGLMPIVVDIMPFSEALFFGNAQVQTN